MNVAIVGAPGTGKSRLLRELQAQRPGLPCSDASPLQLSLTQEPAPDATTLQRLLAQHRQTYTQTLLTGLDLADAHCTSQQEKMDALLRASLQQAGIGYGVVYGREAERLRNALRLISPEAEQPARWRGACERCADPACEHRLFTELQGLKAADRPPA
jgi:ATPase subunit of ABC transporter with duplicated ATPase domains